jgi:hypothetical protein
LTLVDAAGNTTQAVSAVIVVFDSEAGFVTGGGWFLTPAGAYMPDTAFAGHTNFGLNVRYPRRSDAPRGNLNVIIAGRQFRSAGFDWLVIRGATARMEGRGTIDGNGEYGFGVTLLDATSLPAGRNDRIRIRIWDRHTEEIIYDTQPGAAQDAAPTIELGGGSIVIH